jgi:hypothetical protein
MQFIITEEQKKNARYRRTIMEKHENIPEFFYSIIWLFLISSITKYNYKIEEDNLGVKKKHINNFVRKEK